MRSAPIVLDCSLSLELISLARISAAIYDINLGHYSALFIDLLWSICVESLVHKSPPQITGRLIITLSSLTKEEAHGTGVAM